MIARFAALLVCLSIPVAWAGITPIKWADLQPDDPALRATLSKLPQEKLARFTRALRQDAVRTAKSPQLAEANAALLKEDFSDLKPLVASARAFEKRLSSEMRAQWNGKAVQLDGYMLPLQQQGKKVTEFLLVPVVGACIHVPPPPPNQMVVVKYPAGFDMSGVFTPVTIRGAMQVQSSTTKLTLVDGSAKINTGYSMSADEVQAYKAKP